MQLDTLASYGFYNLQVKGPHLCGFYRLAFTTAIVVGVAKQNDPIHSGYEYRYCYNSLLEAIVAMDVWDANKDPEPSGYNVRKGRGIDYNPTDPYNEGKPL